MLLVGGIEGLRESNRQLGSTRVGLDCRHISAVSTSWSKYRKQAHAYLNQAGLTPRQVNRMRTPADNGHWPLVRLSFAACFAAPRMQDVRMSG